MNNIFNSVDDSTICTCRVPDIAIIGYKKENFISVPIYKCYNCGAVFVSGDRKWKELADKCKED